MIVEPKLEHRDEQHYAGIRVLTTLEQIGNEIVQNHGEIYSWLEQNGIEPSGPPFIRYHVIDMYRELDIELGVPVASPIDAPEPIKSNTLPAGTYATYLYTGPYENLIEVTGLFLKWAGENGVDFQEFPSEKGDVWVSRLEFYIKDPGNEQDPNKFETELAFLTRDPQS